MISDSKFTEKHTTVFCLDLLFHKVGAVLVYVTLHSCMLQLLCYIYLRLLYVLTGFGNENKLNISVRFDSACVACDYHLNLSGLYELVVLLSYT